MDKAMEMAKTSATGSFLLFVGRIASTLMLAIGSIIVGIYILQADYGLYTIALVPSTTFLLFLDWGIGSALTKYCASYRAAKMEAELRNTIVTGLAFLVATGLTLTLISLLTANFMASTIYNRPESAFLVALASITIFSTAIHLGADAVFVGFERMKLSTTTLIISAIAQGLLSPLLVYLGFGAFGAIVGFTAGSVVSGATAGALLYFAILRKLPLKRLNKAKMFQTLKPMLHYGIPLSVGAIIGGIAPQIYYFVMASSTDPSLIGNFRIATNFVVLLNFFIYPIQTVLFPAFSKINPSNDKQLLKTIFSSSTKYSSLFLAPATIALMVLSTPLITTIYADKWSYAPLFLTLYVIGELFVLLGNLTCHRLLYATGETKFLMKLNILKLCIGAPFAFVLIPPLGILGVIIVSLVAGIPSLIIGLYWTWKRYETKADLRNSARILLASTIAGAITYIFLSTFDAAAWVMLALGSILFLGIYVVSAPLLGAVNQTDLGNLRVMFSGLGPFSKLLKTLLALIEKPLRIKEKLSGTREQK